MLLAASVIHCSLQLSQPNSEYRIQITQIYISATHIYDNGLFHETFKQLAIVRFSQESVHVFYIQQNTHRRSSFPRTYQRMSIYIPLYCYRI